LDKTADSEVGQTNFSILMRRARFIDAFVGDYKIAYKDAVSLMNFDTRL
jgi:hypothetical protein